MIDSVQVGNLRSWNYPEEIDFFYDTRKYSINMCYLYYAMGLVAVESYQSYITEERMARLQGMPCGLNIRDGPAKHQFTSIFSP